MTVWARCSRAMTGQRLVDRNLRRVLDRAADQAAVPRFGPHRFRHTHVSQLLNAGWPPIKVAARIGDRVETVMATYAHFLRDDEAPDLSFAVPGQLGNGWANEHPGQAANEQPDESAQIAH
jgi:integrase